MATDDAQEPLGEVLSRTLDARGACQEPVAPKPVAKPRSIFELAKSDTADAYIRARQAQARQPRS
jgi:hypothetical protein